MVKWAPPHGFTGKVHHLDAKVGGAYKMSFTNFSTGRSHAFGGEYRELVPHERIRHALGEIAAALKQAIAADAPVVVDIVTALEPRAPEPWSPTR